MIWLIGKDGMLGSDVEKSLKNEELSYCASGREVDITDYRALEKYSSDKKVEWVINCAGYTKVDEAEKEKEEAFKVNRDGAKNIAQYCFKIGARLIHISTDYVFDGMKSNKECYLEEDKTNPVNIYGWSKLAGEQEIQHIFNNYFIIRTSWLYGVNGPNFVTTMLKIFREKNTIRVVNDQWGTPTYSKDLTQAITEIIKKDSSEYEIFHYSNKGKTSWFNFAGEIYREARELGLINREKEVKIIPVSSKNYPALAIRPRNSILGKGRIKQTFNIEIRPWADALEEFLQSLLLQAY